MPVPRWKFTASPLASPSHRRRLGAWGLLVLAAVSLAACDSDSPADVVDNPVPSITLVVPSSVTVGDPGFSLTVTGLEFVASSVVRWNGSDRPTTFQTAAQITAEISAADIATAGTALVTVFTPAPGGGLSSEAEVTVLPGSEENVTAEP